MRPVDLSTCKRRCIYPYEQTGLSTYDANIRRFADGQGENGALGEGLQIRDGFSDAYHLHHAHTEAWRFGEGPCFRVVSGA